jgi:hypothetical protein
VYAGQVALQETLSGGDIMLYDSTKSLLQSIVQSLEKDNRTGWDDRAESGNECLYEMHQMSRPLYKGYKSDRVCADSAGQNTISEMVNRAIPHVRLMVIAIRHKDQTQALTSGKAALVELNGASDSKASGKNRVTRESSHALRKAENATRQFDFTARKSSRSSGPSRVTARLARTPGPRRGT